MTRKCVYSASFLKLFKRQSNRVFFQHFSPPPLCGAIGAGVNFDSSLVTIGDHVAALVPDLEATGAEFVANESWILAEVISFHRDKRQFQVEDVDAEEGKV